jgi:metal-responsive CopG/Arc/MetJ family transcriptional regulator|tara:strand:+ start:524 stop:715 length:192 start_codon:yes stop_codon:yes gene_type:complete
MARTVSIKFTQKETELIDKIRQHLNLKSRSETVKAAIYKAAQNLELWKPGEYTLVEKIDNTIL